MRWTCCRACCLSSFSQLFSFRVLFVVFGLSVGCGGWSFASVVCSFLFFGRERFSILTRYISFCTSRQKFLVVVVRRGQLFEGFRSAGAVFECCSTFFVVWCRWHFCVRACVLHLGCRSSLPLLLCRRCCPAQVGSTLCVVAVVSGGGLVWRLLRVICTAASHWNV